MTGASQLSQRIAALALLLGLFAMVAVGAALPAIEHIRDIREQHSLNLALIERLAPLAEREALSEAQIADLRERVATAPRFLAGETRALASAALQQRLKTMIAQHRGKLQTILELEQADGARTVLLRVALSADYPDLVRLMHVLESEEPLVFIDAFDIKTGPPARLLSGEAQSRAVSAKLDIRGHLPPEVSD